MNEPTAATAVSDRNPNPIQGMHPLHTSTQASADLIRRERRVPAVDPSRLLAAMAGHPRGFWGRGERWVAWAGAVSRIQVEGGTAGDRFAQVGAAARRSLAGTRKEWSQVPIRERPRFFGGFSFLKEREGDPVWRGFPSASFVLPRVMLEGRAGEARLVAFSTSEEEAEALAETDLDRLGKVLPPPGPDRGEPSLPDVGPGSPPHAPGGLESPGSIPSAPAGVDRRRWREAVDTVLRAVDEKRVQKAVLSRILDVRLPRPVNPLEALRFLRRENQRAHVFLMEHEPGRIFLGAAPEILAELRGGRFEATAVAGSIPRGEGAERDRELARRLLASEKDRVEHRLTAEEMVEVLEPRLARMEVEDEPRVLKLARIQHLETTIRGEVGDDEDVLTLVEALHPTPAVCGRPRSEALDLIRAAEPFDRGWYAGPVGWFDPAGDGDFVPALRSAVGRGEVWRLFAGAGIVSGSDPDDEWDETTLKFEPALRALGAGAGVS